MLKNAPISRRAIVQNVRIGPPESLRDVLAGVGLIPQGESFGGVIGVFENGGEDALDAVDFDDGRAGFEFLDLGLGAEVEDGVDIQGFERADPHRGYLRGFGAAEEEVGAGGAWRWMGIGAAGAAAAVGAGGGGSGGLEGGGLVSADGAEVVDSFDRDEWG